MKIRIEIDVPEYVGGTQCGECPFKENALICMWAEKRCDKVDFTRMSVKELKQDNEGKALLYAVEKTAKRTKREVIEKAARFIHDTIFNWSGSWTDGKTWEQRRSEYIEEFKQAMEDEK